MNDELTDALIINALTSIGNICLTSEMNDQELKKVMNIISPVRDCLLERWDSNASVESVEEDKRNELYQCPYEPACRCAMDEGCNGCETFSIYLSTKQTGGMKKC